MDLIEAMDGIRRAVGEGRLPAGDAHVVTTSRTYPAEIDDVWDALTNPERIPRWFLPIHGDLRLGGTYQFEGNAGGEIRECEPPQRLLVTWVMGEPDPEDSVDSRGAASTGDERRNHADTRAHRRRPTGDVGAVRSRLCRGRMGPSPDRSWGSPRRSRTGEPRGTREGSRDACRHGCQQPGLGRGPCRHRTRRQSIAARVAATTAFYIPPVRRSGLTPAGPSRNVADRVQLRIPPPENP